MNRWHWLIVIAVLGAAVWYIPARIVAPEYSEEPPVHTFTIVVEGTTSLGVHDRFEYQFTADSPRYRVAYNEAEDHATKFVTSYKGGGRVVSIEPIE